MDLDFEFTPEEQEIVDEYCGNNMYELNKIIDKLIAKKKVLNMYEDDLRDVAISTFFKCVKSFDDTKECKFKTFLIKNIWSRFYDWTRNNTRLKCCNLLTDSSGKIVKDENNKPIIISNVSLDQKVEDDVDWCEKIASDFKIEDSFSEEIGLSNDEKISKYVSVLGNVQRKIATLIMEGYNSTEIKKELNLSDSTYNKYLLDMKSYSKKKLLKEDEDVNGNEEEEIKMDCATTTSEKTKNTSYAISAIDKKLKKRRLRDDHVLQRASGQWNTITKSELVSDILQGKALTQIIISEEIKGNVTMHWLIDGKQRCTNMVDFLDDGFSVSKNVQIYNIPYQTDKVNENGDIIYNEDGFPIPEVKWFDIRNKKFSQLPDELQDKFKEYQVPVMLNLNCTKKDIAYDISRFNRCRSMTISQNGFLGLEETFAEYVNNILKMDFFKIDSDKTSYTASNDKSGALRRMIVESIVASRFIDDYDKNFRKMCEYLTENASESIFIDFYAIIERLTCIARPEAASLFNIKNSYLWLALFDKFTGLNLPDEKFADFTCEFVNSLHEKSVNGITYDELEESKNTKDRNMVKKKLSHLSSLMMEFLHINKEETEMEKEIVSELDSEPSVEVDVLSFIRENADEEASEEDLEFYEDMKSDWTVGVDDSIEPLSSPVNLPSLLALIAKVVKEDDDRQDIMEDFFTDFFSKEGNLNYIKDQKENYTYMLNCLENYSHYTVGGES